MDNIMENIPETDISFVLPDKGFSYRVSGFLLRDGKLVLLKKPPNIGAALSVGRKIS
jgi:hypothetical protein